MDNSVNKDFTKRLMNYTVACANQCSLEAQSSVSSVSQILDSITNDVNRVSKISKQTQKALQDVRQGISAKLSAIENKDNHLKNLMITLSKLAKENEESKDLVLPIIMALQFQDRTAQQLGNLRKMIEKWIAFRSKIIEKTGTLEDVKMEFGKEILAISVSEEERTVIRNILPQLPVVEAVSGDSFFF